MPQMFRSHQGPYMITATDGIIDWYNGPYWDDVAHQAFLEAETQLEDKAKDNAIWEDRTGDARAGLNATTLKPVDGQVIMVLSHGVEYGKWLELIQGGRFGVIEKTLAEEAPRIIRNAMRRIQYARKGSG